MPRDVWRRVASRDGLGIRYAGALPAISFRRLPRAFARGRLLYARLEQPQCFCKTLELPTSQLRECQTPRSFALPTRQCLAPFASPQTAGPFRKTETPPEAWNQTLQFRITHSLDLIRLDGSGWQK